MVLEWAKRDLLRFANEDDIQIVLDNPGDDISQESVKFYIYTATNKYSISGNEKYLGCIASCRTPRAGESHTRGRDLPDGPHTEETWDRILAAIVSYEMVKVFISEVGC